MSRSRRAFTLAEAVAAAVVILLILLLLAPVARRQRLADGLADSLNNVRQILAAEAVYRSGNADQIPMRGSRYSNGQLSGWDTWAFGGKNCRQGWAAPNGGLFDESAYSRPLNQYLYPDVGIARPPGYFSVGSGSTWSFGGGTPTQADRDNLQFPVFRSPGDHASFQGTVGGVPYGTPNPNVTCYNDVGTSYHLNMKWWGQPGLGGGSFTQQFDAGVNRIRALASAGNLSTYVWMHDQIADIVANFGNATGEFGGANMSVCGFLDQHAAYMQLSPGALSGPGYTFTIPNPPVPPPPPDEPVQAAPLLEPAEQIEYHGPP